MKVKVIKKINLLKKIRRISAITAALSLIFIIGAAGGMDVGNNIYSSFFILIISGASFICSFFIMQYTDNTIFEITEKIVHARRLSLHKAAKSTAKIHNIA